MKTFQQIASKLWYILLCTLVISCGDSAESPDVPPVTPPTAPKPVLQDYRLKDGVNEIKGGNLNYIVDMPVDIVKFDKDMIRAYFENKKAKYVMDAAMHMIQGMKLEIVSEGIETEKQFETMKNLQIAYIQGFYFSKPLPEVEYLEFMNRA